jgi:4'-phosphopantetheinyl transferase
MRHAKLFSRYALNVQRTYNSVTSWRPGVQNPILGRAEIHIWRAPLTLSSKHVESFAAALAADERIRAARFRFDRHRNQFIAGRGWLRTVAG